MTMDDGKYADEGDQRGREARLVLVTVFIGGLILIAAADRLLNIGPTLGNILFTALPLLSAVAAAARLHHGQG